MATIKVYARQVPPEHQESPLQLCDEYPENVYVFGNRHYTGIRADEIGEIREALENIAEEYEAMQEGTPYTTNLHAAIWHELPRNSGEGYTREERLKIVRLANMYSEEPYTDTTSALKIVCMILEILHGKNFKWCTLRGCCQGDWQYCIYPAAYGDTFREAFEAEYFNTGSEWIIHDGDDAPEEPEDVNGYSVYCYSYDPRAEIAEYTGVQPDEVQLYEFSGYTRRATWEAAS